MAYPLIVLRRRLAVKVMTIDDYQYLSYSFVYRHLVQVPFKFIKGRLQHSSMTATELSMTIFSLIFDVGQNEATSQASPGTPSATSTTSLATRASSSPGPIPTGWCWLVGVRFEPIRCTSTARCRASPPSTTSTALRVSSTSIKRYDTIN